ncbi:hypothetical protein ACT41M_20865 (plasmid) [Acinetobacter baumannii]|uniref:hypothetical protein n=1 Tax=Acinetobacter baumannii TaxID=470 RepID=UPI002340646B|nr:hypothetical protein [Acinetobacter baumannii]MDC4689451.1 hypothetical protein [Acinetobacter baumannii]MDC4721644.1 hypothetical protein [Acinetobacter baumannii]MDC5259910.1 hypothetical protein [Acinetobacter baumannii]
MTNFLIDEDAHGLAEVLDIVLWDVTHKYSRCEIYNWIEQLKSRPDRNTQEIQEAIAVCNDYLN